MHAELMKWANEPRPWQEEFRLPRNDAENGSASRKRPLAELDIANTSRPKIKKSRLEALGLQNKENILPINGVLKTSIKSQTADKEIVLQTIRKCVSGVVRDQLKGTTRVDKLAVQTIFDNTLKTVQAMYDRRASSNATMLDEKQLLAQAKRVCALNTSLLLDVQEHETKDVTPRNVFLNKQLVIGEVITPRYETPLATVGNRFKDTQRSERTNQSLEESSFITPIHVTRKN